MEPKADEFYIGWQPEAPPNISRKTRQLLIAVALIVPAVSALLVLNQQGFATSSFDFGQPIDMEGILVEKPVPHLAVHQGDDASGQPVFQNILLVAKGKFGAAGMLSDFETAQGQALDGKKVKLQGTLIYHEGKSLLEIDDLLAVGQPDSNPPPPYPTAMLDEGVFMGEIADSKCLFGVMKPGLGKPHRSCAARCISGGIPPVLKIAAANGNTQYLLLSNEDGTSINEEVLPFVGDPVMVCGKLRKMGDWAVLYKAGGKGIARLPRSLKIATPMCGDKL